MNAPRTPLDEESRSHLDKWLAREPEMETARLFLGAERLLAELWGAVLDEWLDACFGLSDPGVARIKLAWWGEALGQAHAESAHPLVRAFALAGGAAVGVEAWARATQAALELADSEGLPADAAALLASRMELARALARIEALLWPQAAQADAAALARSLVLWQRRHHRAGDEPRPDCLPLQLLARSGLRAQEVYARPGESSFAALRSDLAAALLGGACAAAGARLRRMRTRLDALALHRLRAGRDPAFPASGLRVLWRCWRAARG